MLSQQSKYALRAVMYLQQQQGDALIKVEKIAQDTKLPAPYLSKILKVLATKGIITSRRGKNGGVQINRKRECISFQDVCIAVEDPVVLSECVLFKRPCDKKAPCAFHKDWSETKRQLLEFLESTRVE